MLIRLFRRRFVTAANAQCGTSEVENRLLCSVAEEEWVGPIDSTRLRETLSVD